MPTQSTCTCARKPRRGATTVHRTTDRANHLRPPPPSSPHPHISWNRSIPSLSGHCGHMEWWAAGPWPSLGSLPLALAALVDENGMELVQAPRVKGQVGLGDDVDPWALWKTVSELAAHGELVCDARLIVAAEAAEVQDEDYGCGQVPHGAGPQEPRDGASDQRGRHPVLPTR